MFGRTKVSEPFTVFDSQHRYKPSGDYSDVTAGTATVTYNANQSMELLNVGTASGDKVERESKRVFPYQPGKSLQVLQTFCFSPAKNNLRQRAGYYSRTNGFYLELDGNQLSFVERSYVTGSLVETRVLQSDWNIDKLDGTGPSDITLDISKAQILFSEYEWLGVGSVRLGFAIDGYFIVAHQFNHANYLTTPYMTTASLPVRYEIENTGTTSTASSLGQICTTVISNGGYTRRTESWVASRNATVNVSSSFYPLVSIRLASGRTDSVVIPAGGSILPVAQGIYEWAFIKNATITGGTWVNHTPSNGNVDYNISATSMADGVQVAQGFIDSDKQGGSVLNIGDGFQRFDLQLGRTNSNTPVSDTITLALRSLGGTQSGIGSISWVDLL
jgi:hypothetical protein